MATCPICRSQPTSRFAQARDIEYHTSDRVFDFYRCDDCDVLFIDPMLSSDLSNIYPKNYYSFKSGRRSVAVAVKEYLDRRQLTRLLRDIDGDSLAVLDVGGGTGWLLDLLKSVEPRIASSCVVDIDAEAGVEAEANGHRYFHGRFEDYAGSGKYDLIMMLNLIEHVADPRTVLRKARSLLKVNGRLLLKTPNFDALDARLFRHRSWAGYHTPRHFVLFKRESLERLCRECGLEPQRFAYTQGAPFWSVSVLEELRRLGLVTISAERPAVYHPLTPVLQIAAAAFDFIRKPFAKLSQMEIVLAPGPDVVPVGAASLTLKPGAHPDPVD